MIRNVGSTQKNGPDVPPRPEGVVGVIAPPAPTVWWSAPMLYNAAFRTLGMEWRCISLPVDGGQLGEALLGLRALGFVGAEIVGPYQSMALAHAEELSPAARAIGAVTYVAMDGRGCLVGDNAQWQGFLTPLRSLVPRLSGLRPLIIGAGGAARSIVYALTLEGLPLTIVDEDIEQAIDLVHRLRHVMDEHSFSVYRWPQDAECVVPQANLIINTTGIGRWPEVDRTPWPDGVPFAAGALAFDLVSWPIETCFLRWARSCGAITVSGLSLSVCEAALVFSRWTERAAPIRAMWRAALQWKALADAAPHGLLDDCPRVTSGVSSLGSCAALETVEPARDRVLASMF